MKNRCFNPKCDKFGFYGGRGISVCDRWRDSFDEFLADVGPRPGPNYSLDRIDNDGNYEPGNVRWATKLEQSENRRKRTKFTRDDTGKFVHAAITRDGQGAPSSIVGAVVDRLKG